MSILDKRHKSPGSTKAESEGITGTAAGRFRTNVDDAQTGAHPPQQDRAKEQPTISHTWGDDEDELIGADDELIEAQTNVDDELAEFKALPLPAMPDNDRDEAISDAPNHTRSDLVAAAKVLVEAKDAGLGTLLFGAMVDTIVSQKPAQEQVDADSVQNASGPPELGEIYSEMAEPPEETDKNGKAPEETDPNAPEADDYRIRGQFGARASETYYRNLPAFVQGFVANVFSFQQGTSCTYKWVKDWWRYPQIVFPLDAMWRNYEAARKQPNGMMVFYIQAFGVIDRVFNPDKGIVADLGAESIYTDKGESLPCEAPPKDWRSRVTAQLAIGHDEPGPAAQTERHAPNREHGRTMRRTPR